MKLSEAIGAFTQRNFQHCKLLVVCRSLVWVEADALPRLFWCVGAAWFCDGELAFPVRGLFSSEFQARLWCEYHGFGFAESVLVPKPADFFQWEFARRVCAPEAFSVTRYAQHQERCPDCRRRYLRGVVG